MLLWDGTIGRQEAADSGLVSPDYRVYELAERVASDFMRYVVRDPRMLRHYQGGARGTNVRRNRIAREDFLRIPFHLPPRPEQRKIAAILSSVDEVIEKTEAMIEQLQVVKKAMMQELLTRGLPGRHTRFKQTEIGRAPDAWDVVPLLAPRIAQPMGLDSFVAVPLFKKRSCDHFDRLFLLLGDIHVSKTADDPRFALLRLRSRLGSDAVWEPWRSILLEAFGQVLLANRLGTERVEGSARPRHRRSVRGDHGGLVKRVARVPGDVC